MAKPRATKAGAKTAAVKKAREHAIRCSSERKHICYVCGRYAKAKQRVEFSTKLQEAYKAVYHVQKIKNLNAPFSGGCVCGTCKRSLTKKEPRFRPCVWHRPDDKHSNCYICDLACYNPATLVTVKNKARIYREGLSADLVDYKGKDGSMPIESADSDFETDD